MHAESLFSSLLAISVPLLQPPANFANRISPVFTSQTSSRLYRSVFDGIRTPLPLWHLPTTLVLSSNAVNVFRSSIHPQIGDETLNLKRSRAPSTTHAPNPHTTLTPYPHITNILAGQNAVRTQPGVMPISGYSFASPPPAAVNPKRSPPPTAAIARLA